MLDSYMWGVVGRISPEAPVPVVEVTSETIKLGGAANVVNNIQTLGARAIPFGVVGDDASGAHIRQLLEGLGLKSDGIITDPERPTTVKTRIIAHDQHVVRADVESKGNLSKEVERQLLDVFRNLAPDIEGVILEDYNKGVLTPDVISQVVDICRSRKIFVAVDPKFNNFFEFRAVDLFKPNTRETEQALGVKIDSDEVLLKSIRELFSRLNCRSILITRGEKGMTLFETEQGDPIHVPTRAKKIHDVSGAGDTVIAAFVVSKLAGSTHLEAATLANFAAGIVCGEVGVVPIDRDRLWEELLDETVDS